MKRLSKAEILDADDLPWEDVEVPELNGIVRIRSFTGDERDAFESSLLGPDGKPKQSFAGVRARLVALTSVDDQGERIFSDDDIAALGKKSAKVLDRLFSAAQRLNGLSRADVDSLKKD